MIEILILNLITLLGGFVVGLTGFGFVLICVPLLTLIIDVKLAIAVAVFLGWLTCLPLTIKMHAHIKKKAVAILFIGAIPGTMIGTHILHIMPSQYVVITMSLVIILSSVYCLRTENKTSKQSKNSTTLATGFASGVLGASVGEGGPPVVSYSVMQPWSAEQAKATMLAFFSLQMALALINYYLDSLLTNESLQLALTLIPGLTIGVIVGLISFSEIQKRHINFQRIMHFCLIILGAYLLIKVSY
ncbi:MAG: sulfite exporter TauE/SafE family protein [Colwellia sp.]